ncbi:hypothetical protein OC834_005676 [Tilletia horrida]|nr:hypothetical protein OC834_005676 [Tilletia horrida]
MDTMSMPSTSAAATAHCADEQAEPASRSHAATTVWVDAGLPKLAVSSIFTAAQAVKTMQSQKKKRKKDPTLMGYTKKKKNKNKKKEATPDADDVNATEAALIRWAQAKLTPRQVREEVQNVGARDAEAQSLSTAQAPEPSRKATSLLDLPNEVLIKVLYGLHPAQLVNLAQTNRRLRLLLVHHGMLLRITRETIFAKNILSWATMLEELFAANKRKALELAGVRTYDFERILLHEPKFEEPKLIPVFTRLIIAHSITSRCHGCFEIGPYTYWAKASMLPHVKLCKSCRRRPEHMIVSASMVQKLLRISPRTLKLLPHLPKKFLRYQTSWGQKKPLYQYVLGRVIESYKQHIEAKQLRFDHKLWKKDHLARGMRSNPRRRKAIVAKTPESAAARNQPYGTTRPLRRGQFKRELKERILGGHLPSDTLPGAHGPPTLASAVADMLGENVCHHTVAHALLQTHVVNIGNLDQGRSLVFNTLEDIDEVRGEKARRQVQEWVREDEWWHDDDVKVPAQLAATQLSAASQQSSSSSSAAATTRIGALPSHASGAGPSAHATGADPPTDAEKEDEELPAAKRARHDKHKAVAQVDAQLSMPAGIAPEASAGEKQTATGAAATDSGAEQATAVQAQVQAAVPSTASSQAQAGMTDLLGSTSSGVTNGTTQVALVPKKATTTSERYIGLALTGRSRSARKKQKAALRAKESKAALNAALDVYSTYVAKHGEPGMQPPPAPPKVPKVTQSTRAQKRSRAGDELSAAEAPAPAPEPVPTPERAKLQETMLSEAQAAAQLAVLTMKIRAGDQPRAPSQEAVEQARVARREAQEARERDSAEAALTKKARENKKKRDKRKARRLDREKEAEKEKESGGSDAAAAEGAAPAAAAVASTNTQCSASNSKKRTVDEAGVSSSSTAAEPAPKKAKGKGRAVDEDQAESISSSKRPIASQAASATGARREAEAETAGKKKVSVSCTLVGDLRGEKSWIPAIPPKKWSEMSTQKLAAAKAKGKPWTGFVGDYLAKKRAADAAYYAKLNAPPTAASKKAAALAKDGKAKMNGIGAATATAAAAAKAQAEAKTLASATAASGSKSSAIASSSKVKLPSNGTAATASSLTTASSASASSSSSSSKQASATSTSKKAAGANPVEVNAAPPAKAGQKRKADEARASKADEGKGKKKAVAADSSSTASTSNAKRARTGPAQSKDKGKGKGKAT